MGFIKGSKGYRDTAIAMLAAGVTTFMVMYFTQGLLPEFSREFHITPSHASLSVSLTTICLALFIVPMSLLSQKYGKYQILKFSTLSVAIITILLTFAPNFQVFLVGRALQGILIAGIPAVAIAYVSVVISPASSASAMGLYIAGTAIGGLIGRIVATATVGICGWHGSVLLIGCLALLSSFIFIKYAPRDIKHNKKLHWSIEFKVMVKQLMNPSFIALFLTGFLLMGGFVSTYNYMSFYLLGEPFKIPQTIVSFIFVTYLVGTYTSVKAGQLEKKIGHGAALISILALAIIGIIATLSSHFWVMVIGLLVFTGCFFAGHSLISHWLTSLANKRKTEASALYFQSYYLGSGVLGTSTGVAFLHWHWLGVVSVVVINLLLCIDIILLLSRRISQ